MLTSRILNRFQPSMMLTGLHISAVEVDVVGFHHPPVLFRPAHRVELSREIRWVCSSVSTKGWGALVGRLRM